MFEQNKLYILEENDSRQKKTKKQLCTTSLHYKADHKFA